MMKKILSMLLAGLLLLSLFACGKKNTSDIPKQDDKEEETAPDTSQTNDGEAVEKEELSFAATFYTFNNHIGEKIHFFSTKSDLEAFCDRNGLEDNERFMQAVAKYDDSYFGDNILIWYYVNPEQRIDVEVQSIEHEKLSSGTLYTRDKYIINMHYKIYMEEINSFGDAEYRGVLIEVNGFHNMMLENTDIHLTAEEFYP